MNSQSNEAPEGFKMTELGPLPEEWGVAKFDTVVTDISTGDWGETNPGTDLQQCYVLRGTDFYQALKGSFTNTPIRYHKTSSIQKRQLRDGDILIELSGGSKDQPTGRIMIVNQEIKSKSSLPLVFSNFVKRLNVKTDLWPEFFWQYWEHLYQGGVTRIYEKRTTGIRNFKLNDFLASEHIPLPPLPEQKAIARVLFTIQKAVEAQDKIIAAARELKKSLMRHLFAYGPVPVSQTAQVLLKETEIGLLPEHWEVLRLGEVALAVGSGLTPRGGRQTYLQKGIPLIRSQNVEMNKLSLQDVAFISPEVHESMSRSAITSGDVLLNITGASIGRVTCVPEGLKTANVNQHVCRIRLKESAAPEFVSYFLSSSAGQFQIMGTQFGTTRQGLNYGQVKALQLPLPPLPEQQEIARMLSSVDDKIEVEENRKSALQALFKTMLHHLMTGKVRVKDLEVTVA